MEDILAEVKSYDIPTLRAKLIENGVPVGPIAPSSISLFQKRLAKEIFRKQGGVIDEQSSDEQEIKKPTEHLNVDQKKKAVAPNISGVYYAVCLPESIGQEHEGNKGATAHVSQNLGTLTYSIPMILGISMLFC